MVEGVSVKTPADTVLQGSDGGSPWSIVEQGQLSKAFARCIHLQLGGLCVALEDLGAVQCSLLEDIHAVTGVTLNNDRFTSFELFLLDGINDDVEFSLV